MEQTLQRLISCPTDDTKIIAILDELKDEAALMALTDQAIAVRIYVPWALEIFKAIPVSFVSSSFEQAIRSRTIEALLRLSFGASSGLLRPYVESLMSMLLEILEHDNEINALSALHLVVDYHKNFRTHLEQYVQPFLDYALSVYECFDANAARLTEHPSGQLFKARESFKVITECPVTVVLLFQIHRRFINENVARFVGPVINALSVTVDEPTKRQSPRPTLEQVTSMAVPPERAVFCDLIAAQVKTLSFLAYMSRGFSNLVKPRQEQIPIIVISLLKVCPIEAPSTRKELLVAVRHILSTDLRVAFVSHLEELLDEKLVLGTAVAAHLLLRPLAFSLLADLIHHVREELTPYQLDRIVSMYSGALLDPSLPLGIQAMSAKLLFNLVDSVVSGKVKLSIDERRPLLMRILMTVAHRISFIRGIIEEQQRRAESQHTTASTDLHDLTHDTYYNDPLNVRPIHTDSLALVDPIRDTLRDLRFLVKTLVTGLKGLVSAIKAGAVETQSISPSEGRLFVKLYSDGIIALDSYVISARPFTTAGVVNSIPADEKDLLDTFAAVFGILDAPLLHEVVGAGMNLLISRMQRNISLLAIPQYMLSISGVSHAFASHLAVYLMENLADLGGDGSIEPHITLRLFKLLFLGLSVFPEENEAVLQPHLISLITRSLDLYSRATSPMNFLLMIRSLFRSIGGGRFELLYKQFVQILEPTLDRLNKILATAIEPQQREVLVELCLTTPVRLSILIPYLRHLVKPLVLALQSRGELVVQALRTLELCVDNLSNEFLEPVFAPVQDELMVSLFKLLTPSSTPSANTIAAMRFLGKMAGRNRRYLGIANALEWRSFSEDALVVAMKFERKSINLPLDKVCNAATCILRDLTAKPYLRLTAMKMIVEAFALLLDRQGLLDVLSKVQGHCTSIRDMPSSQSYELGKFDDSPVMVLVDSPIDRLRELDLEDGIKGCNPSQWRRACEALVVDLLGALFVAAASEDVGEESRTFLERLYGLAIATKLMELPNNGKNANLRNTVDASVFWDALADAICEADESIAAAALMILETSHRTIRQLLQTPQLVADFQFYYAIADRLVSRCYSRAVAGKLGACRGIAVLCRFDLDLHWIWAQEIRFVRALIYVLKDVASGSSSRYGPELTQTLFTILKIGNRPSDQAVVEIKSQRTHYFNQLVAVLVSELSNPNAVVREAIQASFQLLADSMGCEVTELLLPLRDRMLTPIFTKPLRALPFTLQIGYIDAITYCLSLRPPLLAFNDELLRLLHEALALADADDQALTGRPPQRRPTPVLGTLRVVCIRLLAAAMACAEFSDPRQAQLRTHIVAVFFKMLYVRASDVVEAAQRGLAQIIGHQQRLPRETLQQVLRPVLLGLAEPRRLPLPALEGLSRVLQLLTTYFRAEIGRKLLDHLTAWAEPSALEKASSGSLRDSEEVTAIAIILDIFHLLPPSANTFMSELVSMVVNLESCLKRRSGSPFRTPLLHYLARYPTDAIDYFLEHLADLETLELFVDLFELPEATPLIGQLASKIQEFIDVIPEPISMPFLSAIRHLVMRLPSASSLEHSSKSAVAIRKFALKMWSSSGGSDNLNIPNCLLDILHGLIKANIEDIDLIVALFAAGPLSISVKYARMTTFLRDEYLNACPVHVVLTLIKRVVEVWPTDDNEARAKATAIRLIVLPALKICRNEQFDAGIASTIIPLVDANIWTNHSPLLPELLVEELQLAGSLTIHYPEAIMHTKALQLLLLRTLDHADPVIRCAALSVLVNLLDIVNFDEHSMLLMLGAAFEQSAADLRPLIRQLIEQIFDILLKRPGLSNQWILMVVAALEKEGHHLSVTLSLWQVLTRPENGFHAFSGLLWRPLCVSWIRVVQSQTSSIDNRVLLLDVPELLLTWLLMDVKTGPLLSPIFSEGYLNSLLRVLASGGDFVDGSTIFERGLKLLSDGLPAILSITPNITLRLGSIDRIIASEISDENIPAICAGLRLLACLKNAGQVTEFSQLARFFELVLLSQNSKLLALMKPLLEAVYGIDVALLTESKRQEFSTFVRRLEAISLEGLQFYRNLPATVMLMDLEIRNHPETAESKLSMLIRLFQRMSRDFLARREQASSSQSALSAAQIAEETSHVRMVMIPCIDILAGQISSHSYTRQYFLQTLQTLWEGCSNIDVMRHLISIMKGWIEAESHLISLNEITELLLTPSLVESIGNEALMQDYLRLVLAVYKTPGFSKSDLTLRLEGSFLRGLRESTPEIRDEFIRLLNASVSKSLPSRLRYMFAVQNWHLMGAYYWLAPALEFLLSASAVDSIESQYGLILKGNKTSSSAEASTMNDKTIADLSDFVESLSISSSTSCIKLIGSLLHSAPTVCHHVWISFFPALWQCIPDRERSLLIRPMTTMLSDDRYKPQTALIPNVMQTILEGCALCDPVISLPPSLVWFVGQGYRAWHSAACFLESMPLGLPIKFNNQTTGTVATEAFGDTAGDALRPIYQTLGENDMYYGLMRRRALLPDTNNALSYAQNSIWTTAQQLFETTQTKARNGTLPFVESECNIWESQWIECAKRLQQWDLLAEVAKLDGDAELSLESNWRLLDWNLPELQSNLVATIQAVSVQPTSRHKIFEAFMLQNQSREQPDRVREFQRAWHEGVSLSLNEWNRLPTYISPAHRPLLERFQLFVEQQEAQVIFNGFSSPGKMQQPQFVAELKGILNTWRERLPNRWDDINVWSDLMAWRQHVYNGINTAFQPLIPEPPPVATSTNGVPPPPTHPFAFRGYHETAWLINRFAKTARQNGLKEVSLSYLNRIYTLPNIEIQDAYLKLREQTKCHLTAPADLATAMEVVNATNLNYFSNTQKADFFTLKATVLERMGMYDDANRVYAQAGQIDLNLAKAWSSWGHFNDLRFQQTRDATWAAHAINCYLQAATLLRASKARRLIARVLWIVSSDDPTGTVTRAFDTYAGEIPAWHWVIFIPQLLTSLTRREALQTKSVLMKIAKTYPQALYLPLRTANEDFKMQQGPISSRNHDTPRQSISMAQSVLNDRRRIDVPSTISTPTDDRTTSLMDALIVAPSTDSNGSNSTIVTPVETPKSPSSEAPALTIPADSETSTEATATLPTEQATSIQSTEVKRSPGEHADDIMAILKTGSPLLALSLENMVDHIMHRLRSSHEEDLYRIISALIAENFQHTMIRLNAGTSEPFTDTNTMESSLNRVAEMIEGTPYLASKFKDMFRQDFVASGPTLTQIMTRLQQWKTRLESMLAKMPNTLQLEHYSRYLAEFEQQRYDEVEIPGQYLLLKESNADFVRIDRFDPRVQIVRRHGTSYRRLTIRGQDGSIYYFVVQNPSARQCRREERIIQLFRLLNGPLDRHMESRRRNLSFHLPIIVPLSTHIRLIQDDPSYISLAEVYEDHCSRSEIAPDDVVFYLRDSLQRALTKLDKPLKRGSPEYLNLRVELYDEITSRFAPPDLLTNFMIGSNSSLADYWTLRRQITQQYACATFLTYVMTIGHRFPFKISFSRRNGSVLMSELLPSLNPNGQLVLLEAVPFRFTPNLQHYMTTVGVEGVFTSALMSVARAMTEPEFTMGDYLTIFLRDEIVSWFHNVNASSSLGHQSATENPPSSPSSSSEPYTEQDLQSKIAQNVEITLKRAQTLACVKERETASEVAQPVNQTILDLLSCAVNPQKLAQMDGHWHPWL